MEREWVCLLINQACEKKGLKYLEKELTKIFDGDLREFRIVVDEELVEEGFYAFVRSDNYEDHVSALISSYVVKKALPSCQNPDLLSEAEVQEFVGSVLYKDVPDALRVGDVVEVSDGVLKNLYGLVVRRNGNARYDVFFKFYVRQFTTALDVTNLRYVTNVFQHMKFPVTVESFDDTKITDPVVRKAFREIISEDQLYRRTNRILGR